MINRPIERINLNKADVINKPFTNMNCRNKNK